MRMLATFAVLLLPTLAGAQTLQERLQALEQSTARINALADRLAVLESKVDALAGGGPVPAAKAPGGARVFHEGCEWSWDTSLGVYRPVEPGWTYVPERNVWRQAAPQMQYFAPMGFQGGACAGGSCGGVSFSRRGR